MLHAHGRKHLGHDASIRSMTSSPLHEAHLDVHLRELGLAVGAQVFVAEAPRDLVVALDAAHHEHLLELLGALRQRVELARVRAARHDVVARALGRGVREDGRFHLEEAALVERGAHGLGHRVAQVQRPVHLGTAQVQVAPLHTGGLVRLDAVLDGERRRDARVEDLTDVASTSISPVAMFGFTASAPRSRTVPATFSTYSRPRVLGLGEVFGAHAVGIDDHLRVSRRGRAGRRR